MKRPIRTLVILLFVGLVLIPAASGQDSLRAVAEKAGDERTAAEDDTVAYAQQKATGGDAGDDLRWAVQTTCMARGDAEAVIGQEAPDPAGLCPVLEDVIARAAEEEQAEEEDVAVAEPLDDDTEARIEAYLDEGADMVQRILEEPTAAIEELPGFLDRTLTLLRHLTGNLLGTIGALGTTGAAAAHAPLDALRALTHTLQDAADALRSGAVAVVSAPVSGMQATVEAASEAKATVADAATGLYEAVRELFAGGPTKQAADTTAATVDSTAAARGRIPDLPELPADELGI